MTALASPSTPTAAHPADAWTLGRTTAQLAAVGAGLVALRATPVPGLPCPMLAATGVACPGCGMTRAADAVATGHLGHALSTDPAGALLVVAMAAIALTYLVLRLTPGRAAPRWATGWVPVGVLGALLAAHWVTTVVSGGFVG